MVQEKIPKFEDIEPFNKTGNEYLDRARREAWEMKKEEYEK